MDTKQTIREVGRFVAEHYDSCEPLQPEKPFFTLYIKERHWYEPLRMFFGAFKVGWFEKGKQKKGYRNAFDTAIANISLDTSDITITRT